MLISFNRYGAIERKLTHGIPARQGVSGSFEIVCYFNGRQVTDQNYVTIIFRDPSGHIVGTGAQEMTYEPEYEFTRASNDDINTIPFLNGVKYPVHKFSIPSSGFFSEYGTYEATVSVYQGSTEESGKLIDGLITIPVQKSAKFTTAITQHEYDDLIEKIYGITKANLDVVESVDDVSLYEVGKFLMLKENGDIYEVVETEEGKDTELKFSLGQGWDYEVGYEEKIIHNSAGDEVLKSSVEYGTYLGTTDLSLDTHIVGQNIDIEYYDSVDKETKTINAWNIVTKNEIKHYYRHGVIAQCTINQETKYLHLQWVDSDETAVTAITDLKTRIGEYGQNCFGMSFNETGQGANSRANNLVYLWLTGFQQGNTIIINKPDTLTDTGSAVKAYMYQDVPISIATDTVEEL